MQPVRSTHLTRGVAHRFMTHSEMNGNASIITKNDDGLFEVVSIPHTWCRAELRKYREGYFDNHDDEADAGGLWDIAGENSQNEQEQEQLYNAMKERFLGKERQ